MNKFSLVARFADCLQNIFFFAIYIQHYVDYFISIFELNVL